MYEGVKMMVNCIDEWMNT